MQEIVFKFLFSFLLILLLIASCQVSESPEIVPGVSKDLAVYRKNAISDVHYDLFFDIPEDIADPIPAQLNLVFNLNHKPLQPLIIDFNVDNMEGIQITQDSDSVPFNYRFEHIVIDRVYLKEGTNKFTIQFMAGELSLNRSGEYLYTLFVPDRASTAFPCFDQPDLKARFTLTLEVPEKWKAVSNYSLRDSRIHDGRKRLSFNETAPIPTYLFAFAIGKFSKAASLSNDGMEMNMYYRETDSVKVASNLKEIFSLHEKAITWMEEYTGIKYPFEKFDFVLIPTFQYGGMEHPGSIFYRERSLFLDEAATLNDKLGRASLISHETAHIWFGDLVTMKWFNDVWSKEVFANFMADKIVNPSFTEIDHNLKFLLQHFPSAYSVDRTLGANAIRQPLDNLKNAGLMYGPIIYNKAPVMMKHLEALTGPKAFQYGMQEYLSHYAFENASWNDLIKILDSKTELDLTSWSKIWIEQPGMPTYWVDQTEEGISINQKDPLANDRIWMQNLRVLTSNNEYEVYFDTSEHSIETQDWEYVLLNGKGFEYGSFILDEVSIAYFLSSEGSVDDSFLRGRIWLNLYESFLAARISKKEYVESLLEAIEVESDPQVLNQLFGQLRTVFWKFLDESERILLVERIESTLLSKILKRTDMGIKMSCYQAYSNIFMTESARENLKSVLGKQEGFMGIPLSPSDYTALSMQLAVRTEDIEEFNQMMQLQLNRLKNPDMIDRLKFIIPALSPDQNTRDTFFEFLKDANNREQEPWVLTALNYLHHPLRQASALKYLNPGLELVGEIQSTGDIFFPGRWLDAILGGHQSEEALGVVEDFMGSSKALELDPKLQLKIWVSSDLLRRSVEMKNFEVMNDSEMLSH